MYIRWLVYRAFACWKKGEPLPLDIYGQLVREGLSPENLEEAFEEGAMPGDIVHTIEQRVDL